MEALGSYSPITVSINKDSAIVKGASYAYHKSVSGIKSAYGKASDFLDSKRNEVLGFFASKREAFRNKVQSAVKGAKSFGKRFGEGVQSAGMNAMEDARDFGGQVASDARALNDNARTFGRKVGSGIRAGARAIYDNMPVHISINRDAPSLRAADKFLKETLPEGAATVKKNLDAYARNAKASVERTKQDVKDGVAHVKAQAVQKAKEAGDFVYRQSPIHVSVNRRAATSQASARLLAAAAEMQGSSGADYGMGY